jgi:hypothetical protein
MGKNEKTPITVNDKEYILEDMTPQQQAMVNHINDLDRKLSSARFNVDQLAVGREAFVNLLAQSLDQSEEITDEDYEEVSADPAD